MPGAIIPVVSRRRYDFSTGYTFVPVVTELGVRGWTSGVMLLRVHSNGVTGASTFRLQAFISAPSPEDPAQDFVFSTTVASCTVDPTTSAPGLVVSQFNIDTTDFLRFYVEGNPSTGNCIAIVSADIVMKRAS